MHVEHRVRRGNAHDAVPRAAPQRHVGFGPQAGILTTGVHREPPSSRIVWGAHLILAGALNSACDSRHPRTGNASLRKMPRPPGAGLRPPGYVPTMAELRLALADALGPLYRVEREVRPVGECRMFVAREASDGGGPELLVKVLPRALSLAVDAGLFEREVLLLADRLGHDEVVAPLRADMFAVGVLVQEMLLGRPAAPEQEPLEKERALPDWMPELLRRCGAAKPAARWADAAEALAAMRPPPGRSELRL